MSLNGLDAANVLEAYQSAVAEPGGWFLLRYASRDGVELLAKGKGGVHEARVTISKYSEASPLYGLLIYRRRKVLVKYIPEGTSRVLQARTAVHFQDVVDWYQPYETLLEITTAEGLNDTSLAAAFPLHTATATANANRLHEISEDAEDTGSAPKQAPRESRSGSSYGTRQSRMERRVEQQATRAAVPSNVRSSRDEAPSKTAIASQILVREDSGKHSITSVSSPLSESFTDFTAASTAPSSESASREATSMSSLVSSTPQTPAKLSSILVAPSPAEEDTQKAVAERSERNASLSPAPDGGQTILPESGTVKEQAPPVVNEPPKPESSNRPDRMKKLEEEEFDFSYLEPKQKVRLAPRPVAQSVSTKRATTSGVSALPAHYRSVAKKQDSQTSSTLSTSLYGSSPHLPVLPVPPIPEAAEYNPRPISRGSVRSLTSAKNSAMTPDKIRLMKAVELRKKQLRKSNSQLPSSIPGVDSSEPSAVPDVPQIPEQIKEVPRSEVKAEEPHQRVINEDAATKKADSGIEMDYDKAQDTAKPADQAVTTEPANTEDTEHDPAVVAALRNDEIKAEAEGYGAVPMEEAEDKQPRLVRRNQANPELSPSSNYSDAQSEQPASLSAVQAASQALEKSQTEEQPTSTAPAIVMSPSSPSAATFGKVLPTPPVKAGAELDEESEESDAQFNVQQSPRRQNSDLAKRRRGLVEPLALDMDARNDILADDDDLMEELQSADVEEARSMSVARSPATAYFPRRPSNLSLMSAASQPSELPVPTRKLTDPSLRDVSPGPTTTEAAASPVTETSSVRRPVSPVEAPLDTNAGIRRNVSSGIAKRFQALAETSGSSSQESLTDRRKRSPHQTRTSSFRNRWGTADRTSSASTIASENEPSALWSVAQDGSSNRGSINVRARIVRPPSGLIAQAEKPDAEEAAQLQQSRIEISHGTRPSPTVTIPSLSSLVQQGLRSSPTRSQRSTFSPQTAVPEDFPAPPTTTSRVAPAPANDDVSGSAGKTDSRTSRFFKRMSSLGGNKRRSAATTPLTPTTPVPIPVSNESMTSAASNKSVRTPSTITEQDRSDMPPAAALGDLNVQFPDTLLWKRRWVTLDDAGNLILGVSQIKDHQRGASQRKYHLSEFKLPVIPDLDHQEMPHSVCLDVQEGGTLQIACEDSMSQRQVLSMLRTYYKSWVV